MVCDRVSVVEHDLFLLNAIFDLVPLLREGDGWQHVVVLRLRRLQHEGRREQEGQVHLLLGVVIKDTAGVTLVVVLAASVIVVDSLVLMTSVDVERHHLVLATPCRLHSHRRVSFEELLLNVAGHSSILLVKLQTTQLLSRLSVV